MAYGWLSDSGGYRELNHRTSHLILLCRVWLPIVAGACYGVRGAVALFRRLSSGQRLVDDKDCWNTLAVLSHLALLSALVYFLQAANSRPRLAQQFGHPILWMLSEVRDIDCSSLRVRYRRDSRYVDQAIFISHCSNARQSPAMECTTRIDNSAAETLRGTAAFFGAFTLLNLVGELIAPPFDATIWWLDARCIPVVIRSLWMLLLGIALLRFAFVSRQSRAERLLSLSVVSPALFLAAINSANSYDLVSQGMLQSRAVISFSLFVMGVLAAVTIYLLIGRGPVSHSEPPPRRRRTAIIFGVLACCIGFPLLQIHCFGKTDYRRKADAAVVFGCRVYADGSLSAALEDRVRTGVELYQHGLVRFLVMTGGPGSGDVHETQAMRRFAINNGVPPECVLVDEDGWNTDRSVASTVPLCEKLGLKRVLAVSHDFHLPRIKLAYARAGQDVFTVPARQKYRLAARPFLLARETVALWAYYLRPLTHL